MTGRPIPRYVSVPVFHLDSTQIFQSGQTENLPAIREKPRLPLRHYALPLLKPAFPTVG